MGGEATVNWQLKDDPKPAVKQWLKKKKVVLQPERQMQSPRNRKEHGMFQNIFKKPVWIDYNELQNHMDQIMLNFAYTVRN